MRTGYVTVSCGARLGRWLRLQVRRQKTKAVVSIVSQWTVRLTASFNARFRSSNTSTCGSFVKVTETYLLPGASDEPYRYSGEELLFVGLRTTLASHLKKRTTLRALKLLLTHSIASRVLSWLRLLAREGDLNRVVQLTRRGAHASCNTELNPKGSVHRRHTCQYDDTPRYIASSWLSFSSMY